MSEQPRVSHPKESLLSIDVERFDSLAELALDMRSSWNHATDQVWWQLTHNPWVGPTNGLAGETPACFKRSRPPIVVPAFLMSTPLILGSGLF
jgi:hypothetical protein